MAEHQLDDIQISAVNLCLDLSKRLVGISGGPGTGKTSIMKTVADKLTEGGHTVALCAPTGKAAKRIQEATGYAAVTNHRLLEYPHPGERDPKTGKVLRATDPKRCRQFPLDADVILADEFMMVNREVYQNIINAMKPGSAIRVFGDVNQLPPIEKSALRTELAIPPFKEILEKFHGVELKQVYRQQGDSTIISNSHLILGGRVPKRAEDFKMTVTDRPIDALRSVIKPEYLTTSNQVITPTKKGWTGTWALNAMLQPILNKANYGVSASTMPERHSWVESNAKVDELTLYIGDKVMWSDNNDYNLQIFNGEMGHVLAIDEDTGAILIDFGDRSVEVPTQIIVTKETGAQVAYNPQKNLELAYAITTHKAQGSEYDEVIYVLNKSSLFVQSRPNLYTAVTRARNNVTIITDQRSLAKSLAKPAA